MFPFDRRQFLARAAVAGAAVSGVQAVVGPHVLAGSGPRRIKVGQIGMGHAHAAGKMETFRKYPDDFEVLGIVEPDAELRRRHETTAAYRDLKWMSEEELLAAPGLRLVAVETTVRDLVPTAGRCVAAGMHVHLDKPGGESLAAYRAVLEAAQRRKLCLQMGFMYRYNPAFQDCFRAVREGWLGEIFQVHGVMAKIEPPAQRQAMAAFRGGVMFELGCHLIDALVCVLGKPQRITPFGRHIRPDLDNLLDHQWAVFEYPRATGTIEASVVEVEGGKRRQFVVCGTEGTLEIKPLEPPKLTAGLKSPHEKLKAGYQEVPLPEMPGRYDQQLLELARIVRGELENPYSWQHDLTVHEAVLQAAGCPLEPA